MENYPKTRILHEVYIAGVPNIQNMTQRRKKEKSLR